MMRDELKKRVEQLSDVQTVELLALLLSLAAEK